MTWSIARHSYVCSKNNRKGHHWTKYLERKKWRLVGEVTIGGGGGGQKTRYQDAISTLKEEEEKTQKLSYPKRLGQDTTKAPPPLKGEHMLSDLTQHHMALYGDRDAFGYRCLLKGGENCNFPSSEWIFKRL